LLWPPISFARRIVGDFKLGLMSHPVPLWQFGPSVENQRTEWLLHCVNFDAVAQLLQDVSITDYVWEPFKGSRLKGCYRASFLVRVSLSTYDAFFNSPVGYRAQYALAPSTGERANRQLLFLLEQRLLAFAIVRGEKSESLLLTSLRSTQAKIWIYEREVEAQLGGNEAAILYQPWMKNSLDGAGLLAPVGQYIEVKGGWLDTQGNERIDPAKTARSDDIHNFGFS